MNKIYLLLGSNMGNSREQMENARQYIKEAIGEIKIVSHLYLTAAWGNTEQGDFLNQVILVTSSLPPRECLEGILVIEEKMGRVRTVKNAPRIIDIDILYYNDEVIDTRDLSVPHPAIPDRRFVLIPLNEISPEFVNPVHGKSNHELLKECKDELSVKKIAD